MRAPQLPQSAPPAARPLGRRALGGRLARVATLLAGPVPVACAGPWPPARAGAAGVLYVANGGDATVSRLDPQSGRPVGPPLPAGPAPAQLAPGPGGTLLVLPAGGPAWRLTHVAPPPHPGGESPARAVPLEPGGSGGGARLVRRRPGRGGAGLPRPRRHPGGPAPGRPARPPRRRPRHGGADAHGLRRPGRGRRRRPGARPPRAGGLPRRLAPGGLASTAGGAPRPGGSSPSTR